MGGIFLHYLWEAPLETVVILWLGLWQVGVSFLSAFVALALLVPMQVCEASDEQCRTKTAYEGLGLGWGI